MVFDWPRYLLKPFNFRVKLISDWSFLPFLSLIGSRVIVGKIFLILTFGRIKYIHLLYDFACFQGNITITNMCILNLCNTTLEITLYTLYC